MMACKAGPSMQRFEGMQLVDSHLHVWSPTYQYATGKLPPPDLGGDVSSVEAFRDVMHRHGISGALVVQPVNYAYDHSYLEREVYAHYGDSMKLMLLLDPSRAMDQLEELPAGMYAGVRFNPYLQDGWLSSQAGVDAFRKCGKMGLPVGIMCFQGLHKHVADIEGLLQASPDTDLVIDHWGFFRDNAAAPASLDLLPNEECWQALLRLGQDHPDRIYVKLSALFRVSSLGLPYTDLEPRLKELLHVFSARRLMYGSDFPFVEQEANGGYGPNLQAFHDLLDRLGLEDADVAAVMGGTARGLFFDTT